MTYSNCGQKGYYNKHTYRGAFKNARQEHAQDRDLDSDTTSSKDSSDQESLNSELERERQWQAEIDQYNAIMARAEEIAARQRQEEVEDNDIQSDSELSLLASSLFDGMDIEGIELSDIEIDGTAASAGLADQDSQGNSLEDVGSRVGGRMTIQGAGTSLKCTKSGKVVKYKDD